MNDQHFVPVEEMGVICLLKILVRGWATIAACVVLVGSIGLGISFLVPEKFVATGSIWLAQVQGKEIDVAAIVLERMQSPTYYSQQTMKSCGIADYEKLDELIRLLKPNFRRNTSFINISARLTNVNDSVSCLNSVLADIKLDQNTRFQAEIEVTKRKIDADKKRLKLSLDVLSFLMKRLEEAGAGVAGNLIQDGLVNAIDLAQNMVVTLETTIDAAEIRLKEPFTLSASFATPILASPISVAPNRPLITGIGVVVGVCIGLMLLLLRSGVRRLK